MDNCCGEVLKADTRRKNFGIMHLKSVRSAEKLKALTIPSGVQCPVAYVRGAGSVSHVIYPTQHQVLSGVANQGKMDRIVASILAPFQRLS